MQHFAAFLGGLILGVLLAAASGLDLYDRRARYLNQLENTRGSLARLRDRLDEVELDRRRIVEKLRGAQDDAVRSERDLLATQSRLDAVRSAQVDLHQSLRTTSDRLESLELALEVSEAGREVADDRIRELRDEVAQLEETRDHHVLALFDASNPDTFLRLARRFLRVSEDVATKRQLILSLRRTRPEWLLSLGEPQPPRAVVGAARPEHARPVPSSHRLEVEPTPAEAAD